MIRRALVQISVDVSSETVASQAYWRTPKRNKENNMFCSPHVSREALISQSLLRTSRARRSVLQALRGCLKRGVRFAQLLADVSSGTDSFTNSVRMSQARRSFRRASCARPKRNAFFPQPSADVSGEALIFLLLGRTGPYSYSPAGGAKSTLDDFPS